MSTTAIPELRTRDVAERLQTDIGKVLDWINSKQLVAVNIAVKPGGQPRWRIRLSDLEDFLRRRESTASDAPAPTSRRRKAADGDFDQFRY